jgi:hypothetical protein
MERDGRLVGRRLPETVLEHRLCRGSGVERADRCRRHGQGADDEHDE